MRFGLAIIFFFTSIFPTFGQTIEELAYDLSWHHASEKYGEKIEQARKLLAIDSLNFSAVEYTCRFYADRQIDSVSIFFDQLILNHPKQPTPLIFRYKLLFLEHNSQDKEEYLKWATFYLNLALKLDKTNKLALYYLSETYYKDFIFPLEKEKHSKTTFTLDSTDLLFFNAKEKEVKKSVFDNSAESALSYFYELWAVDKEIRDVIYFPIRQLEYYLSKQKNSPIHQDILQQNDYCYFPSWYFMDFTKKWATETTANYLYEASSSKYNATWLSSQLIDLQEPCLFNQKKSSGFESYRFTWLRSFDNPISIRIEKNKDKVILYWKVGKGAGGYPPEGLKKSGKKKISRKKWKKFTSLVEKANFNNLPKNSYFPSTDGASWTLEYKTSTKFKAHRTNHSSGNFKESCLYLLKLSKIKVKDKDIY